MCDYIKTVRSLDLDYVLFISYVVLYLCGLYYLLQIKVQIDLRWTDEVEKVTYIR